MSKNQPHYEMHLNDRGLIELAYIGPQTVETVEASLDAAKAMIRERIQAGKPANFIIDYGRIGKTTVEANRRAMRGMKELQFHRMAGINAKPVIRFITNTIASFTGDSKRAKHFKNPEEAERWLLES
jgi:hypothetical protein